MPDNDPGLETQNAAVAPQIAGGTTPNYALPWPAGTSRPAGPAAIKALAQAVEAALNGKASTSAVQSAADAASAAATKADQAYQWAGGVGAIAQRAEQKADNANNALGTKLDKAGGTMTGNLHVPKVQNTEAGTSEYAANTRISAEGWIQRAASSSRRYKTDIRVRDFPTGSEPEGLLRLPVTSYLYNQETHPTEHPDVRHVGLIAEDVADCYPAGVERDAQGRPETWAVMPVVAGLLALVQDLHDEVGRLAEQVRQSGRE